LDYYENNLLGLLVVLRAMKKHGVKKIVFSSSATVYGRSTPPLTETSPTGGVSRHPQVPVFARVVSFSSLQDIPSPYGQTKFMAERILQDFFVAEPTFGIALLRYFNPVGAHASGLIGEDPAGIPNNLVPYIQRVAAGRLPKLTVHGSDYATPDGTAQRDYIHVVDLAVGHLKALDWLQGANKLDVFNLGTGLKVTVLEMVHAYEKASGKKISVEMGPRRLGDVEAVWADATKAKEVLKWEASFGIDRMCEDSWRWVQANPDGYNSK
jgi:UDP-glucose 4-epimerase